MRDLLNKSLEDLYIKLDIQKFAYSNTRYTNWHSLGTGRYRFYFVITESVNIPANTSSLAVKGYIQVEIGSEGSIAFSTLSFASSINGSYTNSSQKSKTFTSNSSYLISTITHTITHNADGTKSITWRGRGRPYYSSTSWDEYTSSGYTITLETIPRYATISSFTLSNQTLSTCDYSWATDVTCDQMQYSLNGGAWVTSGDSGTGDTGTISGLSVGVSNSVKIRVKRTDSQLYTESSIVYITTLQKGLLTNSANWNDEANPVISFTNINSQDLVFRIEAGGSTMATREVGTIASGDYTFELTTEERNLLRALITTNINSLTTRFTVATLVGETETYWSYADKTMSLINYNPTFLDYAYEDINANSLIMTGDSSVLINGVSNVKTTISSANKMVANKQATAVKYRTNLGTKSEEIAYSSSASVDMTINSVDAGIIYVSAIDSRGNLTQVIKTATIKAHSTPVITDLKFERQNGISTTVNVIGSGTYTNENYGAHTNTIVKIEYSTDNTNWTDITSKFDISGGTFANKSSGNTLTGFTVGTEYTLYFRVKDGYSTYILSTALSGGTLSSGQPLLDLNKTKKGIGFGGINETEDTFDCFYHANFKADVKKKISNVDYDLLTTQDISPATSTDFTKLHAITSTADELNILDGVTANKDEINVLDGIPATLTATELGYLDGVTSNVQTQFNGLEDLFRVVTHTFASGKQSAGAKGYTSFSMTIPEGYTSFGGYASSSQIVSLGGVQITPAYNHIGTTGTQTIYLWFYFPTAVNPTRDIDFKLICIKTDYYNEV